MSGYLKLQLYFEKKERIISDQLYQELAKVEAETKSLDRIRMLQQFEVDKALDERQRLRMVLPDKISMLGEITKEINYRTQDMKPKTRILPGNRGAFWAPSKRKR